MDPNQQPQQQTNVPAQEVPQSVPTVPEQQPTQSQPPQQVQSSAENPGKVLGIVSLVTGLIGLGLVGLILGIIGMKKSKNAGMSNGFALAGIIVSVISMILGLLLIVGLVIGGSKLVGKCQELGPGTHYVDGVTYTCS